MRLYNFLSVFLFLLVGINNVAFAQTRPNLYMFIVIQQDAGSVGALDDGTNMADLAEKIKNQVPTLNVVVKQLTGEEATQARIESELATISGCSNDIIWYYYSGHGRNNDTWPETDEQDVPLTWVHSKLKEKGARLTLAMYDCCAYQAARVAAPSDLQPKSSFWKPLLLTTKGNYIASACSSTEFAAGASGSGSIFTNNFIDAFHTKTTWPEIFVEAKRGTIEDKADQHPVWDGQNTGSSAETHVAPGSYKVNENETWEAIVKNINTIPGEKTNIEALKAKNPSYKDYAKPPKGAKLKF